MFLDGQAPFSLAPDAKEQYLAAQLAELLEHHRTACPEYGRFVADWNDHRVA